MLMPKFRLKIAVQPSVTEIWKTRDSTVSGVPETSPVFGLSESPLGRLPIDTANV